MLKEYKIYLLILFGSVKKKKNNFIIKQRKKGRRKKGQVTFGLQKQHSFSAACYSIVEMAFAYAETIKKKKKKKLNI